jgi:hypothetical protein
VSPRDQAIAALADLLGREPGDVARVVDLTVAAAAQESCQRVNESLVDQLRVGTAKMYGGLEALLFRASRELGGGE